jgi:hypothetical protein
MQEGRQQIQDLLREVEIERSLPADDRGIEWNPPTQAGDHKLRIVATRRERIITFTYVEVADCCSAGADGVEMRERLKRRIADAVDDLLNASKSRIGF